jgi:hypothetical protein
MLYKKDVIELDEDIAKNSAEETETTVLFGESVGKRR